MISWSLAFPSLDCWGEIRFSGLHNNQEPAHSIHVHEGLEYGFPQLRMNNPTSPTVPKLVKAMNIIYYHSVDETKKAQLPTKLCTNLPWSTYNGTSKREENSRL